MLAVEFERATECLSGSAAAAMHDEPAARGIKGAGHAPAIGFPQNRHPSIVPDGGDVLGAADEHEALIGVREDRVARRREAVPDERPPSAVPTPEVIEELARVGGPTVQHHALVSPIVGHRVMFAGGGLFLLAGRLRRRLARRADDDGEGHQQDEDQSGRWGDTQPWSRGRWSHPAAGKQLRKSFGKLLFRSEACSVMFHKEVKVRVRE